MKKLLYLTDEKNKYLIPDEAGIKDIFQKNDLEIDIRVWDNVDWKEFENILIRTPWDYSQKTDLFLQKINSLNDQNLINSKSLIKWNLDKSYLVEFYNKSLPVIETIISNEFQIDELKPILTKYSEIVVKPLIGAGGVNTFLVNSGNLNSLESLVGSSVLIQPFISSIKSIGEISLIYFNGEYSHGVVKNTKAGEFRVQDDHGGSVQSFNPDSKALEAGHQILSSLNEVPVYARVDLVMENDKYLLMELELIEPELFFRFSKDAMDLFARAVFKKLI